MSIITAGTSRCFEPAEEAYVSTRQHTSAFASIRQHTSAHVSIRQHTFRTCEIEVIGELCLGKFP
jgi:hypothetical protein